MKNSPLKNVSTKLLTLATSLALSLGSTELFAHGQAANMLPLNQLMQSMGASVKYDSYAGIYTIQKNSTIVKIKPNTDTALVNGKILKISLPMIEKDGQTLVSDTFSREVFQSGLDQTFQIEKSAHPINTLNADEIKKVKQIIQADKRAPQVLRFSRMRLKEPGKQQVWDSLINHKDFKGTRTAEFSIVQSGNVIEGEVNLKTGKISAWKVLKGTHGMILPDDYETIQNVILNSAEYHQALAKRGITDPSKVVGSPLTVGYFGGEDGLNKELSLLKVVSYLDVGDGNYWAHPIENLVAVVDLEKKKIVKIEDGGLVPVPMVARAYDGRDKELITRKPLNINEPEGKNYTIEGQYVHWGNWCFHVGLDQRVGLQFGTVIYKDKGVKRKIMYQGNLGGMVVPYGDPDVGWYFKSYLDNGEYGMGFLTSPIERGIDAPENAVLLDSVIADFEGNPITIPNAIAIFERYAGPEFKHQEMMQPNVSAERRELVVRWISTVGNYDYIFDWVFSDNGTMGINAGATGIEAVKGVEARTMHDPTAKQDTRYGTLIDHNIVGTTHQHIYNFRLDLDVDGENNVFRHMNPVVKATEAGSIRKSAMEIEERVIGTEQEASEKFDPSTIRLIANSSKENKVGNPVSYQLIPYAGGTHPIAKGANFSPDEWLFKRLSFMDKQIWVTKYNTEETYPEGNYPNQSDKDTGLGMFVKNNDNIKNEDLVVWLTTGTTHVARAEEWPIMPTEWVNVLLKPWNFFDETPTLKLNTPKSETPSVPTENHNH